MANYSWSGMVSFALPPAVRTNELPSTLPQPKDLSLGEFMRWSLTDQIAFIEAKGTGTTPKTVTIGDPGNDPDHPKPTVTLGYTTNPQGLKYDDPLLQPEKISKNALLSWSPDNQLAYIARFKDASGAVYLGASQSKVEVDANGKVIATGVIVATAGDAEPIPYHNLAGSAAGTPSTVISTSAEWLFPTLDGENVKLPVSGRPAAFSTTPAMLAPSVFTDDELPRPPGLTKEQKSDAAKLEFLASFAKWHSAYQLEYIKTHQTAPGANSRPRLDIVVGSPELRLTAFVSPDDPTRHFVVQSLDKAAIGRMTKTEQDALTQMESWDDLSVSLGLSKADMPALSPASNKLNGGTLSGGPIGEPTGDPPRLLFTAAGYVDELIYAIENTEGGNKPFSGATSASQPQLSWSSGGDYITVGGVQYFTTYSQSGKPPDPPGNGPGGVLIGAQGGILRYAMVSAGQWALAEDFRVLPPDAQQPFITQLEILKEQIGNSAIVDNETIKTKVDELRQRFNRLFAFHNVKEPTTGYLQPHDFPVYEDVITLDGGLGSINRGYSVFLAQEKRIAKLAEERMTLVREDGILNGKRLDVPYLVYKFQSLYNLSLEAQVVAETEEVNQKNDLLKTYARMQDLLNETLALFDSQSSGSTRLVGKSASDLYGGSPPLKYVVDMFEDNSGYKQKHPLEILGGISRPLLNMYYPTVDHDKHKDYDLVPLTYHRWSSYGTRVSETVTLINQDSQIKMNDINSMDKERNRHFELANNALAKMADIISNIARA